MTGHAPDDLDAPPSNARRPRRRWLLAATGITLVALAVAATVITVQSTSDASLTSLRRGDGEQALAFRLPDLRDPHRTIDLSDFAGRPVVLNFWESW